MRNNENIPASPKEVSKALKAVSPIFVWTGKEYHIPGTAVLIAENLALAARHVIEDIYQRFFNIGPDKLFTMSHKGIVLDVAVSQLETGAAWHVNHVWSSNHTDAAFLALTPKNDAAKNMKWHKLGMDLRIPHVGTKVTAVGFRRSEITSVDEGVSKPGITHVKANCELRLVRGDVQEIHPSGRDKALKFTCFQTNAPFDPQMSGGAVLDDEGFLRGLVCTGFDLAAGDEGDPISYVAGVMPVMAILLDKTFPNHQPTEPYPALELAKKGFLIAQAHERVTITVVDGKSRIQLV